MGRCGIRCLRRVIWLGFRMRFGGLWQGRCCRLKMGEGVLEVRMWLVGLLLIVNVCSKQELIGMRA